MIYFPASVLRNCRDYVELERRDAIVEAAGRKVYSNMANRLIVEDPERPVVRINGRRGAVAKLDPWERRRLLICTAEGGLEPAALWLSERGLPMTPRGWQEVFKEANARCRRHGVCRSQANAVGEPEMSECVPLCCRNVALTSANRTAFAEYLARVDEQLAHRDLLAPFVRHRLELKRTELSTFLGAHSPQESQTAQ